MIRRGPGYITHSAEDAGDLYYRECAALADQQIRCYRCNSVVAYCSHVPTKCEMHGTRERGMTDFSYQFFCWNCRQEGVNEELSQQGYGS